MEQIVMAFDYTTLDTEARIVVAQRTIEIKDRIRRSAQDIFEIGERLIEVKEHLQYQRSGNGFGAWLKAEFDWSADTAGRFINVAQRFGKVPQFAELSASVLYLLASPSTPDEARAEALERAEAGERISHTEAKAIVAAHAPAKKPVPPPVRREAEEMDEEPLDAYEAEYVAPAPPLAQETLNDLMARGWEFTGQTRLVAEGLNGTPLWLYELLPPPGIGDGTRWQSLRQMSKIVSDSPFFPVASPATATIAPTAPTDAEYAAISPRAIIAHAAAHAAAFTPDELIASARACLIRLDLIAATPFIESLPSGKVRADWRADIVQVRTFAHAEVEEGITPVALIRLVELVSDPEMREALRARVLGSATSSTADSIRQELEALTTRKAAGMFDDADRAALVTLDSSLVRQSDTLSDDTYRELAQHLGTLRAGEPPLSDDEAFDLSRLGAWERHTARGRTSSERISAHGLTLITMAMMSGEHWGEVVEERTPGGWRIELAQLRAREAARTSAPVAPDAPVAPKVVPPTALTPDDLYAQAEKRLSDLFRQANPDFLRLLALGQDIDLTPDDTDETAQEALWESLTDMLRQYTPEMWAWGLRLTETARRAA